MIFGGWVELNENHLFYCLLPVVSAPYRSLPSHNACTEPNPTRFISILFEFLFFKFECVCSRVTHKHVCIGKWLNAQFRSLIVSLCCSLLSKVCHCMYVCIFKMDFVQGSPFYLCAVVCSLAMFVLFRANSEAALEQVFSSTDHEKEADSRDSSKISYSERVWNKITGYLRESLL